MSKREYETQEDMPYTVVGSTAMPEPRQSILLTGEGIHELARRMGKDDRVRITMWSDVSERCEHKKHYTEFVIIRVSE